MGRLAPVARRDLIRRLLRLGFDGPFSGGRHEFMLRADGWLILPNPHRGDVSVDLLSRVLEEAGVTREGWEANG